MFPAVIKIGPVTFHLYGLIIAIAIYLGWLLAKKRARIYKVPLELFEDPILALPLFLGIVGARLYHIIDYWSLYKENLILIIQIYRGGLGIWGGLVGALIGFIIIARKRKIDLLSGLDLAAPAFLLGQSFGRIANYFNQEGFGPPTNLPWGIFVREENRPIVYSAFNRFHPVFFYEATIDFLFLIILLYFERKNRIKGRIFSLYLMLYSFGRFVVEFYRLDTAKLGNLKVAQLLATVTFLFGIYFFLRLGRLDNH